MKTKNVLILQHKYSLFQYLNECKHIMIQKYAKKYVICGRKVHRELHVKKKRLKVQIAILILAIQLAIIMSVLNRTLESALFKKCKKISNSNAPSYFHFLQNISAPPY